MSKHVLKLIEDILFVVLIVCSCRGQELIANAWDAIELLQYRVHVASSPCVLQSNESAFRSAFHRWSIVEFTQKVLREEVVHIYELHHHKVCNNKVKRCKISFRTIHLIKTYLSLARSSSIVQLEHHKQMSAIAVCHTWGLSP